MRFFAFITCIVACSITITPSSDYLEGCEHRTFQVGQGSCHTVLYSVRKRDGSLYKTLVFCDMGSSSRSAPTKLMFHQNSFGTRIFKQLKEKAQSGKLAISSDDDSDDSLKTPSESAQPSEKSTSGSDLTTDHKDPFDAVKMTKEIEEVIKNVDGFIVMLTHPDNDHINLYTALFRSITKPILLICGGMWAEHRTNEVVEICKEIAGKNNVKAICLSYLDNIAHDDALSPSTVTTPLCGEHGDLLSFINGYCSDYDYMEHFELKEKLAKETFESLILKNIYLWSAKHLSDDTNAQSLIFSCTLPEIKTSFVFTGDATPETFKSIPVDTKNQLRKYFKPTKTFQEGSIPVKDHKVCFVIPHHGATGHYSQKACDLFKPDVLLLSSGYTSNFNHPDRKIIRQYVLYLKKLWKNKKTPFLKDYELAAPNYRVALYDKNKHKYMLRSLKDKTIALLGTNVFGSILINRDGVYTSGNNEISGGYYMDFRKCVASCNFSDKIFDKNGKIDKKFLVGDESTAVSKIEFNTTPEENGEYISTNKKYKLIKKSGGKGKGAKDSYYLCRKASG